MRTNEELETAAKHWESLAQQELDMGTHEVAVGVSLTMGVYNNRADTYRRTAKSLRLEAKTGVWHCVCCLKPQSSERRAGASCS